MRRSKTVSEKSQTGKKTIAILALVEGQSIDRAAAAVGISRATLYRWLNDSTFAAEVERGRAVAYGESLGRLRSVAEKAVDVLVAALGDRQASERRRAAGMVLEIAFKSRELEEFSTRLARLEERLER